MNQKIIVVDNFYDIAHMYHKSFSEHVKEINPQELPEKLSHVLDRPINIVEGFNIVGLDWKDYVVSSEKYFRPNEVDYLLGDPTKIKNQLGWSPEVDFKELVKMMVENDLNEAEKELTLVKNKLLKPTWEHPAK